MLARAPLTGAHYTDALDQLCRRAAAFSEEGVGAMGALTRPHSIAGQDHRDFRRDFLEVTDKCIAVHLRQPEVGENEIDLRRGEESDSVLSGDGGGYAES